MPHNIGTGNTDQSSNNVRALSSVFFVLVIVGAAVLLIRNQLKPINTNTLTQPSIILQDIPATSSPAVPESPATTSTSSPEATTSAEVLLETPEAGARVVSPLSVRGQAQGSWFFEASLPIVLLDANGTVLAQTPGEAQSDWMTPELVSFTATLNFATPTSASGILEIRSDNPSGLPENDKTFRIPVTFSENN